MQYILRMAFIQSLSNLISHGINYKRDMEPSPYILSTSPPDSSMELYVLKHKLQVCTIPKTSMKKFCHAIIKVALLPDSRCVINIFELYVKMHAIQMLIFSSEHLFFQSCNCFGSF